MQRESVAGSKTVNTRNVLNCIVDERALTRSDISKKLGLSKPTVSLIVNELLEDRWIYETGSGHARSEERRVGREGRALRATTDAIGESGPDGGEALEATVHGYDGQLRTRTGG